MKQFNRLFNLSYAIAMLLVLALAFSAGCSSDTGFKPDTTATVAAASQYETLVVVSPNYKGTVYGENTGAPLFLVTPRGAYVIPLSQRESLRGVAVGQVVVCPPNLYNSWPRVADAYGTDAATAIAEFKPNHHEIVKLEMPEGPLTAAGHKTYSGTCVTGQVAAASCNLPDVAKIKLPAVALTKLPRD